MSPPRPTVPAVAAAPIMRPRRRRRPRASLNPSIEESSHVAPNPQPSDRRPGAARGPQPDVHPVHTVAAGPAEVRGLIIDWKVATASTSQLDAAAVGSSTLQASTTTLLSARYRPTESI